MPTTVSALFRNAGLKFDGPVRWSDTVRNDNPGVYVVSLSADPNKNLGILSVAPISIEIISQWIHRVPAIELNGERNPTPDAISNRLAEFWLPDENIIYIGMTTGKLRTRTNQYYNTPLGKSKPHAGGHWLKTLSNLSNLYLYHAACKTPKAKEDQLLGYFVLNVSNNAKTILRDRTNPFPFANIEYPRGTRKKHGIRKSVNRG